MWRDEVCHQPLAKGALLIKDAKSLDPTKYSTNFYFSVSSFEEEVMMSIIYTLPLFVLVFVNSFL